MFSNAFSVKIEKFSRLRASTWKRNDIISYWWQLQKYFQLHFINFLSIPIPPSENPVLGRLRDMLDLWRRQLSRNKDMKQRIYSNSPKLNSYLKLVQ